MNFNEFQNQSRLYVIGALESKELEELERAQKIRQKGRRFHHRMLRITRSIRSELAPSESFRGNQRAAHVDGARTETGLIFGLFLAPIYFTQDKLLKEAVEVYLE